MANEDAVRSRIERAYRERGRGFLAWARQHTADLAAAEDLLQDAFIRAFANADALVAVEDVAGWIFTTMRNRLVDLWRGRDARRRAGAVDLSEATVAEIVEAAGFDPQDEYVRAELHEALEAALEALPAEQREILEAQTFGGQTFREIAERTGIPIDTLTARKTRAVRKLAVALEYWMDDEP